MAKGIILAPRKKGWCAVWFDKNHKQHVIEDSYSKRKDKPQRLADEFMLINLVPTRVIPAIF